MEQPIDLNDLPVFAKVAELEGFTRAAQALGLPKSSVSRSVTRLVDEGIDVAVRMGPLPDSSMVARRLGATRLILVASPGYLSRHGTPATLEALAPHLLIAFRASDRSHTVHLEGPGGPRSLTAEHRVSVNEPLMMRDLAIGGTGIALVPDHLCGASLRDGHLRRVLPAWSSPPIDIHAVYPSRRGLSPKVHVFVEFLAQHLRNLGIATVAAT